jgi:hypothetical protein
LRPRINHSKNHSAFYSTILSIYIFSLVSP